MFKKKIKWGISSKNLNLFEKTNVGEEYGAFGMSE